jgi:uncharacterized protein (TIGR02996 family)
VTPIPDDDEGRLVIADQLIERGDPRGEFIRLSIQLAHVGLGADEAPALVRRHDQLMILHGKKWTRPLGLHVHHHRFRRGFIEEVAIEREAALTDELFTEEAIRDVQVLRVTDLHALTGNPAIAKLRGLSAEQLERKAPRLPVHSVHSPHAAGLESIDDILGCLRPGPRLRRVRAPKEITAAQLGDLLALPELVDLELPFFHPDDVLETLASDPRAARLRSLTIMPGRAVLASPHLAPRRLVVSWLEDEAFAELCDWPPLGAVEELTLSLVGVTDLALIARVPARPIRLKLAGEPDRIAAALASPIVERVEYLTIMGPRPPPALDPGRFPRLIVLNAAIEEGEAHELVRSRRFARLARVRTGHPNRRHPLDRAPL